ncbi:unnamed protein product [Cercospora beticola]|nr:unnamed protein product [Cercospora beticola]
MGDIVPLSPPLKIAQSGKRWYQNAKDYETVFEKPTRKSSKTTALGVWLRPTQQVPEVFGLASVRSIPRTIVDNHAR